MSDPKSALPKARPINTTPDLHGHLTLAVATASLITSIVTACVAYQSFRLSSDSTDVKRAIRNLADLAAQTKRQADSSQDQLTLLKGQLDLTRTQTLTLAREASAVEESTKATVRSTDASASALTVDDARVSGLNKSPDYDGNVPLEVTYRLRNAGSQPLRITSFSMNFTYGANLPVSPRYVAWSNDDSFVEGQVGYGTLKSVHVTVPAETLKSVQNGRQFLFLYGKIRYSDRLRGSQTFCFAYQLLYETGQDATLGKQLAGGPAYRCKSR